MNIVYYIYINSSMKIVSFMTLFLIINCFTVFHFVRKGWNSSDSMNFTRIFTFISCFLLFFIWEGKFASDNRPAYPALPISGHAGRRWPWSPYRCFFYINGNLHPYREQPLEYRSTADLSCGSSQLFISSRLCHLFPSVSHPREYSRPDTPSSLLSHRVLPMLSCFTPIISAAWLRINYSRQPPYSPECIRFRQHEVITLFCHDFTSCW